MLVFQTFIEVCLLSYQRKTLIKKCLLGALLHAHGGNICCNNGPSEHFHNGPFSAPQIQISESMCCFWRKLFAERRAFFRITLSELRLSVIPLSLGYNWNPPPLLRKGPLPMFGAHFITVSHSLCALCFVISLRFFDLLPVRSSCL